MGNCCGLVPPKEDHKLGAPPIIVEPPDKTKRIDSIGSRDSTGGKPPITPSPIEHKSQPCKDCISESPDLTVPRHNLDCSHTLCVRCAKEQLETQLQKKSGNLEFNCPICRAPKIIKRVALTCGCHEDVTALAKALRISSTSDRILKYDAKMGKVIYPMCGQSHPLTAGDLMLLYGRKSAKLDLYKVKMNNDQFAVLSAELAKHPTISELVLDFYDFRGGKGAKLGECIQKLCHIQKLSFRCAKFDAAAFDNLNTGLRGNQQLRSLDMYSSGLIDKTLIDLCGALTQSFSFQKLDISHNIILPEGIKALSVFIKEAKSLKEINLDGVGVEAPSLEFLKQSLIMNKTVTKLDLSNNVIGDEEAKLLSKILQENSVIEQLDLIGTFPTCKACVILGEAISLNHSLLNISLESNKLESHELVPIAEGISKHKMLKSLSLADNALDEKGGESIAKIIEGSKTIENLNLKRNFLLAIGISKFSCSLNLNLVVRALYLKGNSLEEEGAHFIATYLRSSTAWIEELDISVNFMGDKGGISIMKSLLENARLKILRMDENLLGNGFASELAETIKRNVTLEVIYLESNKIDNAGASAIAEGVKEAKGLHMINLENNLMNQVGMMSLLQARLMNLRVKILSAELAFLVNSIGVA